MSAARIYNFVEDGAYCKWGRRYESWERKALLADLDEHIRFNFCYLTSDRPEERGLARALIDVARIRLRNLPDVMDALDFVEAKAKLRRTPNVVSIDQQVSA